LIDGAASSGEVPHAMHRLRFHTQRSHLVIHQRSVRDDERESLTSNAGK
jgi:hypothetical protein